MNTADLSTNESISKTIAEASPQSEPTKFNVVQLHFLELLEYVEIIEKFFDSKILGRKTVARFLTLLTIIKQDIYYRWKLIYKDPDDDKFVDCAIASNADFLISNDAHFKILKRIPFPKVRTIRLEPFAKPIKINSFKNRE